MGTLVDTNKPQNPHPLPYFVFFFSFFFCKSRGKHSGWFDADQRSGGMAARPGLHHSSEAAGGLFNARCQSSSMRRNWPRPIFTVSQSSISSIKPNKQTSYFMRWGTPALPPFWNRAVGVWEPCGPRICVDRPTWCKACQRVQIVDVRSWLTVHFYISRLSSGLWKATGVHGIQAGTKLFFGWPESSRGSFVYHQHGLKLTSWLTRHQRWRIPNQRL